MSDLRRSQRSAGSMDCENGNYPNPKRALSEFHRVLKPNGEVVLADPTAPLPVRCILNSFVRLLRMGDMRMYDRRDLTNLLTLADFNRPIGGPKARGVSWLRRDQSRGPVSQWAQYL